MEYPSFFVLLFCFTVSAFGADTIFPHQDSAHGTAVPVGTGGKTFRRRIISAHEGDFDDIEFIFQQMIYDLDHPFHGHGFFGDNDPAVRMSFCQFRLEGASFHGIGGCSVFDPLFFIDGKNGRQQRIIFPQDQGMVKILNYTPGDLFDFIAGERPY